MANIKSAKKRAKNNEIRRQRCVARRSEIKTTIKSFLAAVESKDIDSAKEFLKKAQTKIARAAGKKVLKKNTASRKISRLSKKLNVLIKQ